MITGRVETWIDRHGEDRGSCYTITVTPEQAATIQAFYASLKPREGLRVVCLADEFLVCLSAIAKLLTTQSEIYVTSDTAERIYRVLSAIATPLPILRPLVLALTPAVADGLIECRLVRPTDRIAAANHFFGPCEDCAARIERPVDLRAVVIVPPWSNVVALCPACVGHRTLEQHSHGHEVLHTLVFPRS
jgi:hypothetical protein